MSLMSILAGVITALSVYLMMSTQLIRWLYGLILFSSAINIGILTVGRVFFSAPAFADTANHTDIGNPLSQAMILTAIVISFAFIMFSLILIRQLIRRSYPFGKE